ncbi:T9SS type A sorting domain-containing protein [Hwangdonia sp.]|uniref:T9SS type A sorting domain-containing protein n=1 Tax=Hwangdonia sp. TaxID=1883432 RepID=UPI003AB84AB2
MTKKLLMAVFLSYSTFSFSQLTAGSENVVSTAPIYVGYGMSVGDITGTGKLDIVSEISDPNFRYLGTLQDIKGFPIYTAQTHMTQATGNFYGSVLGDLDGDGDLDMVTAGPNGSLTSPNNVYYWSSSNSRYEYVGSAYELDNKVFYGVAATIGDFTNDGKPDVVWFGTGSKIYLAVNTTAVADNITFSGITQLPNATSNVSAISNNRIATGDFNADGNLDILVSDNGSYGGNAGGYYQLLYGNGDGTFTEYIEPSSNDNFITINIAVDDFNNDGKLDFIMLRAKNSPKASEVIMYHRNVTNTGFDKTTLHTSTYYSKELVFDDIDTDGFKDILLLDNGSKNINIMLNQGDDVTFSSSPDLSFNVPGIQLFRLIDMTNNGKKEVLTIHYPGKVAYYEISDSSLSVNSKEDYNLSLFPNPTSGKITLNAKNASEVNKIEVLTIDGKLVKVIDALSNTKSITFDIDGESGLYLIQVSTTNGKQSTFKVVKN